MKDFINPNRTNEMPGNSSPSGQNQSEEARLDKIREALERPGAVITGIGGRDTPPADLRLLSRIGQAAEKRGMKGRSGGAGGADLAFERGFSDPKNITVILPWPSFLPQGMTKEDVTEFLGRPRPTSGPGAPVMLEGRFKGEAREMAAKYHPAWDKCSDGAKSLHSRNMPQVLGMELDKPADLVVAWTKDGKASGGTGQAIRIAEDIGVPVANMKNPAERQIVLKALNISDPLVEMRMAQQQQMGMGR